MKPSRIAIVGLGLIGGSLARALKRADAGLRIGAVDLDEKAVRSALDEQAIDTAGGLSEVCSGADLVVIAARPRGGARLF